MRPSRATVATVLATVLAACGTTPQPGSSSQPSSPFAAVPGTPVEALGFRTVVPTGWANHTSDAAAVDALHVDGRVLLLMVAPSPGRTASGGEGPATFAVIALSGGVPDDGEASHLLGVAETGATNVGMPKPTSLDGSVGEAVTYDRDVGVAPVETQEVLVNHGATTYDLLFTAGQALFQERRAALTDILVAWHWTG